MDFSGYIPPKKQQNMYAELREMVDDLTKSMPDYHIISLPNFAHQKEPIEIQVFYEKDFTEVSFEELKQIIKAQSIKFQDLSDEERLSLMDDYCKGCGASMEGICSCTNF